jgi:hypothetical protein
MEVPMPTEPTQPLVSDPLAGVDLARIRAEGRILAAHTAVLVAEDTLPPLGLETAGPVADALRAARLSIVEALRHVARHRP